MSNVILEKRFVERVTEALDLLGINQAELARRMKVSRAMVNQYLNASRSPGLDVVERFAKALDVDPLSLLCYTTARVLWDRATATTAAGPVGLVGGFFMPRPFSSREPL